MMFLKIQKNPQINPFFRPSQVLLFFRGKYINKKPILLKRKVLM